MSRSSEQKDATDSRDDASDGASDDASEDRTGESHVLPNDDIDSLICHKSAAWNVLYWRT